VLMVRRTRAWLFALAVVGASVNAVVGAGGGYIGITASDQRMAIDSPVRAVRVDAVAPGSPAALADLTSGDVIAAVDFTGIRSTEELRNYLASKGPHETVVLTVIQDDGTRTVTRKIAITLTTASSPTQRAADSAQDFF